MASSAAESSGQLRPPVPPLLPLLSPAVVLCRLWHELPDRQQRESDEVVAHHVRVRDALRLHGAPDAHLAAVDGRDLTGSTAALAPRPGSRPNSEGMNLRMRPPPISLIAAMRLVWSGTWGDRTAVRR
uniref:Uncharacterized protein n=1 Tax=Oryza glaberrima TaxID=4538 RepID=I1PTY3_ORYGL